MIRIMNIYDLSSYVYEPITQSTILSTLWNARQSDRGRLLLMENRIENMTRKTTRLEKQSRFASAWNRQE